jgi:hypothetical protein
MARSIWSGTISFGQIDNLPHQLSDAVDYRKAHHVTARASTAGTHGQHGVGLIR